METANTLIGNTILLILSLAGVVAVLDYVGFLPAVIARWIARNRLESTLQALKRLGVRLSWDEDSRGVGLIERTLATVGVKQPAYKVHLQQMLEDDTYKGEFDVGKTRMFSGSTFIDVMGSSTNEEKARRYARILKTHAANVQLTPYDFVATPKEGSPILGYEFSRLVDKPLVLGAVEKVRDAGQGAIQEHAYLDFPKSLSLSGKTALLVDDSSTGGSKMLHLAEALAAAGATVTDALILFEPQGKGARERLRSRNIQLHSIVDGPEGRF
jgi:orotate phosphoribosyltransferase